MAYAAREAHSAVPGVEDGNTVSPKSPTLLAGRHLLDSDGLAERERLIREGKAKFLDFEEVCKELRKALP